MESIKEIKKKKIAVEEEISKLVKDFQEETRTYVSGVNLEHAELKRVVKLQLKNPLE